MSEPTRPLIQINDEVREMTEDEYAQYLEMTAAIAQLPKSDLDGQ